MILLPGQGQAQPVPYTKPDHYQGRGKPSPYPIRSPTTAHIGYGPSSGLALGILVRIACVFVE